MKIKFQCLPSVGWDFWTNRRCYRYPIAWGPKLVALQQTVIADQYAVRTLFLDAGYRWEPYQVHFLGFCPLNLLAKAFAFTQIALQRSPCSRPKIIFSILHELFETCKLGQSLLSTKPAANKSLDDHSSLSAWSSFYQNQAFALKTEILEIILVLQWLLMNRLITVQAKRAIGTIDGDNNTNKNDSCRDYQNESKTKKWWKL